MVVAVPLLNDRVSPRCDSANRLLLVTLRGRRAASHRLVTLRLDSTASLLDAVRSHGATLLVCGGITTVSRELLAAHGLAVVDNVSGSVAEILEAITSGSLRPGFGFGERQTPLLPPGPAGRIDCLACSDRVCERGAACPLLPSGAAGDARRVQPGWLLPALALTAQRGGPGRCRVTELVHFCLAAGVSTLGIAFCRDLRQPARVLADLLRGFFTVVPVACTVRARPVTAPFAAETVRLGCHPARQAQVLDGAGVQLTVLVGLCVGADSVFTAASRAPTTTLFVKDTALAHNPIAAIHSELHLRQCLTEAGVDPHRPEPGAG